MAPVIPLKRRKRNCFLLIFFIYTYFIRLNKLILNEPYLPQERSFGPLVDISSGSNNEKFIFHQLFIFHHSQKMPFTEKAGQRSCHHRNPCRLIDRLAHRACRYLPCGMFAHTSGSVGPECPARTSAILFHLNDSRS